jgi:hypothetical protein
MLAAERSSRHRREAGASHHTIPRAPAPLCALPRRFAHTNALAQLRRSRRVWLQQDSTAGAPRRREGRAARRRRTIVGRGGGAGQATPQPRPPSSLVMHVPRCGCDGGAPAVAAAAAARSHGGKRSRACIVRAVALSERAKPPFFCRCDIRGGSQQARTSRSFTLFHFSK